MLPGRRRDDELEVPVGDVMTRNPKTIDPETMDAEALEKMEMNLALYYKELGRFRVNIFRQRGNVGLVFRHIKAEIQTV